MKKIVIALLAFTTIFVLASSAFAIPQPLMEKAVKKLKEAKSQKVGKGKLLSLTAAKGNLMLAAKNKGGKRIKAIKKINSAFKLIKKKKMGKANKHIAQAIKLTQAGITHANKRYKKSQPLMKKALSLLKKALPNKVGKGKLLQLAGARTNLNLSAGDKGGHRLKAIIAINKAFKKAKKKDMAAVNKLIKKALSETKKGIAFAGY